MATTEDAKSFAERRRRCVQRNTSLKTARSSWDSDWHAVSDYVQTRRDRFFRSERNRGGRKDSAIINSTATRDLRILQSGLMAGLTPRSSPWFRLTTTDPNLDQFAAVKEWLHVVEERLRLLFAKSNLYNGLHELYGSIALFGTSAMHLDDDAEDGIRAYSYPIGSYCLATSARGVVNTAYRECSMTVSQLIERFGEQACSPRVREMSRNGKLDEWVDVLHVIEPRRDAQPGKMGGRNMPFASCWMETVGDESTGFLRESGYRRFPIIASRWNVLGEDVYGTGPAMEALGDVKGLQFLEKQKAYLIEKIADPPMTGPSTLRNNRVSLLPGDMTYVDVTANGQTFQPAMLVPPAAVEIVDAAAREHEQRIHSMFFADILMLLANGQGDPRKTATEVAELHEEKLIQLGPVVERQQGETLAPTIDRGFDALLSSGQLPPPPPELQGRDLHVEYLSVLAQAQKLVGIGGLDRFTSFVTNLGQVKPEALDKLNTDKLVDEYGDSLGIKPDLVLSADQVQAIRQDRARQQQAQQQQAAAMAAAQGAKTLSETNTSEDNGLTRMLGSLGAPAPGGRA